jgi:hypothetical protein
MTLRPASLPDVFVSNTATSRLVSRAVAAGQARRLAPRLYTSNMVDSPETIVRRNLWRVVSLVAPGSVISHRTAIEMRPAQDGSVILSSTYARTLQLPGIRVRLVRGPGPLEGDTPLWDLHIASRSRALLESLKPSRARAGVARGLSRERVEEDLERELAAGGAERVNEIRDRARVLAPLLSAAEEFTALDGIVGALLGTRRASLSSPLAIARAQGEPYDPVRVERFQTLFTALRTYPVSPRPDAAIDDAALSNLAFFDAYFSNFIEGTRFEVDEAHAIVFDGRIPAARPRDAHDVLGTYRLVASRQFLARGVRHYPDYEAFETAVRTAHAEMLAARPDVRPGQFKLVANSAGGTTLVEPSLVRGTLRHGIELTRALDEPFHRAAALMFVLSEVHPFDDGNGRIARAFMNAELVRGQQRRIIIPIVFRDEYVTGLRVLTRQDDPAPFLAVLDFAQRYCAAIDFTEYDRAVALLRATNAFEDPAPDVKLRLP